MRQKNLKDLVNLRSGYSFRGRIEVHADGDYRTIQLKDVDIEKGISHQALIQTNLPGRTPSMLVKNGDIAFVARGKHNYAVCARNIESSTVLSQHFIHMRLNKTTQLSPEYLTWYLNYARQAKIHLYKAAQGTALPTITRGMLEEMMIQIPSLEIQEKIIAIHETHLRERQLLQQLLHNNSISNSVITNQILQEA